MPPDAVRLMLVPSQILLFTPALAVGNGFTVTLVDAVELQPLFVTVTV